MQSQGKHARLYVVISRLAVSKMYVAFSIVQEKWACSCYQAAHVQYVVCDLSMLAHTPLENSLAKSQTRHQVITGRTGCRWQTRDEEISYQLEILKEILEPA